MEAKEQLDRLLRYVPCESICRLKISKSFRGFKGVLKVSSRDKIFLVEEKSSSIANLQKILFHQMTTQLDQWKKERSIDEITGVISLKSFSIEKRKDKKK